MSKKILKTFWFRNPRPGNFGDILTPLILGHYGYTVEHAMQVDAEYISVGSIAKIARQGITVLGSGVMTRNAKLDPEANWRWVRGPLTRKCVINNGGDCPEIYGDPAMLLPRIVTPTAEKKYSVGVVPHYVDYEIVKNLYSDLPVINLLNADPTVVIGEITACEKIISSSLHGIIAAHAYGIPAAWVKFHGKLAGDDTKFHDHYEAFDSKAELSTPENPIFTTIQSDMSLPHDILEQGAF